MNYILDTHALIWFCEGNDKLSKLARTKIEDLNNTLFVSFATLWEIVIKFSLGKLKADVNFDSLLNFISDNNIAILNSTTNHLKELEKLPYFHDDPFDRFIIAQAINEKVPVISIDSKFKFYNIDLIW